MGYVHAKVKRWNPTSGDFDRSTVCGGTGVLRSRADPHVTCPDCLDVVPDANLPSRRRRAVVLWHEDGVRRVRRFDDPAEAETFADTRRRDRNTSVVQHISPAGTLVEQRREPRRRQPRRPTGSTFTFNGPVDVSGTATFDGRGARFEGGYSRREPTAKCGVPTGDGTPCQRPVGEGGQCGIESHAAQRRVPRRQIKLRRPRRRRGTYGI